MARAALAASQHALQGSCQPQAGVIDWNCNHLWDGDCLTKKLKRFAAVQNEQASA